MRAAVLALLFPVLALAAPATVIRAVDLKAAPATDAATLAALAEQSKVQMLERQGGWTRVRTPAGAEGWVRMLALRYAATADARQGDTGIVQLLNVARTGTSGTQVATGVRGLDPEQLKNAKPNPGELKRLQNYRASPDAEAAFAERGRLQSRTVDYPKEGG
jgi:hypothetical protein